MLQAAARDTAYVGFGTSIDRHGPDGRKVVLGCSHIFNEQGQGLQYRLSKIENPIFDSRRRNAFLSRDDARRVGEFDPTALLRGAQRSPPSGRDS